MNLELEELSRLKDMKKHKAPFRKTSMNGEAISFETRVSDQMRNSNTEGSAGKGSSTSSQRASREERPNICLFCRGKHHLDECKKFAEWPKKEKEDFFLKKLLCLGCASSNQHQVATYKNRLKCCTCSGNHPTCLHLPKPVESVTNCVNVCSTP